MNFFSKKLSLSLCVLFISNAQGENFNVNEDSIIESKNDSQEWLSHGRTYDEQRFSELNQITSENIDRLGIQWFADLDSNRGHEATPIVSDGGCSQLGHGALFMHTMPYQENCFGNMIPGCQKKKLISFVAMWSTVVWQFGKVKYFSEL